MSTKTLWSAVEVTSWSSHSSQHWSELSTMKFVQTFFLAACFLSTTANTRTRFKSVKCVLVNSTVAKIRYCDLKAYTRAFVAFNFGVTHLIPLEKPIEVSCWNFTCKILKFSPQDQRFVQVSVWVDLPRCHQYWFRPLFGQGWNSKSCSKSL